MTDVQKQAIKEILHLMVDKEEPAVIADLLTKLPPQYQALAKGVDGVVEPMVIKAEDAVIDKI